MVRFEHSQVRLQLSSCAINLGQTILLGNVPEHIPSDKAVVSSMTNLLTGLTLYDSRDLIQTKDITLFKD